MKQIRSILCFSISLALTACGGGSGGGSSSNGSTSSGSNSSETSNPTPPIQVTCTKGIPSGLAAITNAGMWQDSLYQIDNDYPSRDYALSPIGSVDNHTYLNLYKYTLKNNVLYQDVETLDYPNASYTEFYEGVWQYALTNNGLFTANDSTRGNLGWPISYISNINDTSFSSSNFNDQCDLKVAPIEYGYTKVDISGQPISIVVGRDPNVSFIGYKYITNELGYYLVPFSNTASTSPQNIAYSGLISDKAIFPQGSYIYIQNKEYFDDTTVFFYDTDLSEYSTLNEWANNTYSSVASSAWQIKQIAGYNVIEAFNSDGTLMPTNIDPAVQKDGKIYDAEWSIKGNKIDSERSEGQKTLYNKTAIDALTAQIKTYYLK